jgi:catechol 2,3-dioxygenase-like lactoylglutathione lyase family enzyme
VVIGRLAHYSVRARDLGVSTAFYTRVLGLRQGPRPPFGFPGRWLYLEDDHEQAEQGCVHLIGADGASARDAYLGERPGAPGQTTGALDHIAFVATDWPACRARLQAFNVAFAERVVPLLGVRQVFLTDPDGVTVELNFPEGARPE